MTAAPDSEAIRAALRHVADPEIGANIVDLGLVYRIEYEGNKLWVDMTMTSPACPMGGMIVAQEAIKVGRVLFGKGRIIHHNELGFYQFIPLLQDNPALQGQINFWIGPVIAHDAAGASFGVVCSFGADWHALSAHASTPVISSFLCILIFLKVGFVQLRRLRGVFICFLLGHSLRACLCGFVAVLQSFVLG